VDDRRGVVGPGFLRVDPDGPHRRFHAGFAAGRGRSSCTCGRS
jgi:hypothetical protein